MNVFSTQTIATEISRANFTGPARRCLLQIGKGAALVKARLGRDALEAHALAAALAFAFILGRLAVGVSLAGIHAVAMHLVARGDRDATAAGGVGGGRGSKGKRQQCGQRGE